MRNKSSYGLIMICILFVAIAGVMGTNSTNTISNSPDNSIDNNNPALVTVSNTMVSNNIITFNNSKNLLRSHEKLKNNELAQEIADLK